MLQYHQCTMQSPFSSFRSSCDEVMFFSTLPCAKAIRHAFLPNDSFTWVYDNMFFFILSQGFWPGLAFLRLQLFMIHPNSGPKSQSWGHFPPPLLLEILMTVLCCIRMIFSYTDCWYLRGHHFFDIAQSARGTLLWLWPMAELAQPHGHPCVPMPCPHWHSPHISAK